MMEGLEGGKGEGRGAGGASAGATGRLAQLNRKKQILISAANFGICRQYLLLPRCGFSTTPRRCRGIHSCSLAP